jgi:hypothetical protein
MPTPLRADAVADKFYSKIASHFGQPLTVDTYDKVRLVDWMYRNLEQDGISLTKENLPFLMATALRNMYLKASRNAAESGVEVFDFVKSNPQEPIWGHCGTSSDFLLKVFTIFEVGVRPISLFNYVRDGHVAIEFFSQIHGKFVYYDPLYGVFTAYDDGTPASVDDLQEQVSEFGFAYRSWLIKPVKVYGLFSSAPRRSVNSTYEQYDSLNYSWGIFRSYLNLVAVRRTDTTFLKQDIDPQNPTIRGRWTVYDNLDIADVSPQWRAAVRSEFKATFDAASQGRYHLNFLRGVRK